MASLIVAKATAPTAHHLAAGTQQPPWTAVGYRLKCRRPLGFPRLTCLSQTSAHSLRPTATRLNPPLAQANVKLGFIVLKGQL